MTSCANQLINSTVKNSEMGPIVNDNPPHEEFDGKIDSLASDDFIQLAGSDSEEDNEAEIEFGYQLLPQDPAAANSDQQQLDSSHDDVVPDSIISNNLQDDSRLNLHHQEHLKSDPVSPLNDRLILNSERIEAIKASMAGFTLPASSIPAWATQISEDQWKTRLSSMINNRTPTDEQQLSEKSNSNQS